MNAADALTKVESAIRDKEELAYFLIHEARYKRVLEEIDRIADALVGAHVSASPPSVWRVARAGGPPERGPLVGVSGGKPGTGPAGSRVAVLENAHLPAPAEAAEPAKLRILDVGCYPYHMGGALELMGHEVWGIASAHEPIKTKHVAVLNIETDPFPHKDNFFDLILCSEVVEHLPHSPIPPLREMYRVVKYGGNILVTTPNIVRSINRGKMLLGRSPMYDVDALFENKGKGSNLYHRHNREYTLGELAEIVASAGFAIVQKGHFVSYTPFRRRNKKDNIFLWSGKFANFIAMHVLPSLRDTLLVIGQK